MSVETTTAQAAATEEMEQAARLLADMETSYRLFARLFQAPLSNTEIAALVSADFAGRAKALEDGNPVKQGFNDMGRGLKRRNSATRQMLATDFTMCFDGMGETSDHKVATLYESVFTSEEGLLCREAYHQVHRIFKQEGVCFGAGMNLPDDHVSFELGFMAHLAQKAESALHAGDMTEAVHAIDQSRSFICDHLQNWIHDWSSVALELLETRFYRGVMEAFEGFIDASADTFGELSDWAHGAEAACGGADLSKGAA